MANSMFGTPIGTRAFEHDMQQAAQSGSQVLQRLGEIAMQPDRQRLLQLQGDELAWKMEDGKQTQELMRRAMEQGPQGDAGGPTILNRMDNAAELLMGAGKIRAATDIANTASQMRQREEQARAAQALQAVRRLEMAKHEADLNARLFGTVESQDQLNLANQQYRIMTGQPSPFEGIEYSPELVRTVNAQALTAKDRYDLEERRLTREATEDYRRNRLQDFDEDRRIREERARIAREREQRLAKTGGGRQIAAEPKREERDAIMDMILRDFPKAADLSGTEDKAALNSAMYMIAAEARAKIRANPALTMPMALNQAYMEAKRSGDLEYTPGRLDDRVAMGRKLRYAGGGRSPETALQLPEKVKPAELKAGRYYYNSRGQVARWDGKRMLPAEIPRGLSPDNRRMDEEEDD